MAIAAYGARYPAQIARLDEDIAAIIRQLERPRVVFRPANDAGAWWIGPAMAGPLLRTGAPKALQAAYEAVGGAQPSVSSLVRQDAAHAANAARNQIKRCIAWVRDKAECDLLADALSGLGVKAGVVVYEPPDFPVEILR